MNQAGHPHTSRAKSDAAWLAGASTEIYPTSTGQHSRGLRLPACPACVETPLLPTSPRQVDPSIIGGVILAMGDKYVDMSILARVKRLQQIVRDAV